MSEKKKGWGLYTIRKLIEYAMLISSAWVFGVPWFNQTVKDQYDSYEKEKPPSFRTLLAKELNVPEDRVYIVIGKLLNEQKEHDKLINSVWHILEEENTSIIPRLVIKGGIEYWVANDGHYYRVHRSDDGTGSYYANGMWNLIFR